MVKEMIELSAKEIYMECPVCGQKHFSYSKARGCCDTTYDFMNEEDLELLKKIRKMKK